MKDTTKKTVPIGSTNKRKRTTKNNENILKENSDIDKENLLVHSTNKPTVTQGNPVPLAKRLRRDESVDCKSSM